MKKLAMATALLLGASNSYAINLLGYKFTDAYRFSTLEDTGLEKFQKPLILTTSFAHIAKPLFVTDSTSTYFQNDIIKSYDVLTLAANYEINPQISAGFESVFVKANVRGEDHYNFGDSKVKMKLALMQDEYSKLSIMPALTLPTGRSLPYTTQRSFGESLVAIYERNFSPFHFVGSIGYSHGEKNNYDIINYRNLAIVEFGASYDINAEWNANLELNRNFTLATDTKQDAGNYLLTFKNKSTTELNTYFGGGASGLDTLGRKNWTIFAGLKMGFSPLL